MNGLNYTLFVRDINKRDLAKQLNLSDSAIQNWIKNRKPIPQKYLKALSDLLNVETRILRKEELSLADIIAIHTNKNVKTNDFANQSVGMDLLKERNDFLFNQLENQNKKMKSIKKITPSLWGKAMKLRNSMRYIEDEQIKNTAHELLKDIDNIFNIIEDIDSLTKNKNR